MADDIERFDPQTSRGRLSYEHLHRYALCRDRVRNKRVLDLACGTGYGSAWLAEQASIVTGIDISADAIATCKARYQADGLHFMVGDCMNLPFEDGSFDVVVANELIEHVPDHSTLLSEAKRVLTADGLLMVSTPNKPVYNKFKSPNPFHVSEVDVEEFATELRAHFANVEMVGTRMALLSIGWRVGGKPKKQKKQAAQIFALKDDDEGRPRHDTSSFRFHRPEYILAMCCDAPLPRPTEDATFLLNSDDDLWEEHERVIAWASHIHVDYDELYQTLLQRHNELIECQKSLLLAEEKIHSSRTEIHELQKQIDALRIQIEKNES